LTPHSFDFACEAGIPQPACAVHVQGLKGGKVVAQKRLVYPALPSGLPEGSSIMNQTTFVNHKEWANVEQLTFSINQLGGGLFNGALMIDSFKYDVGCAS
jgi:hypothetical protein